MVPVSAAELNDVRAFAIAVSSAWNALLLDLHMAGSLRHSIHYALYSHN